MTQCVNMAEQRLMVAAWRDPAMFYRQAEAHGLADSHFEDRLASSVASYLLVCAERGETPRLSIFEAVARELAIPYHQGDFHRVFVETTIPAGADMADLIIAVIECWEDREQRRMNEIIADSLRDVNHVQTCPDCIRCSRGERRERPTKKTSWKDVEYVAV